MTGCFSHNHVQLSRWQLFDNHCQVGGTMWNRCLGDTDVTGPVDLFRPISLELGDIPCRPHLGVIAWTRPSQNDRGICIHRSVYHFFRCLCTFGKTNVQFDSSSSVNDTEPCVPVWFDSIQAKAP